MDVALAPNAPAPASLATEAAAAWSVRLDPALAARTGVEASAARIVRLDPALAARTGARCLDGSPGAFYWYPATSAASAERLVIYLEGGGECRTADECAAWRGGSGPSSLAFPPSRPLRRGELSADPLVNPDMHDWAKLILPYCSADMHSGTRLTPSAALGGAYFGGHNLIAASLAALPAQPGFFSPSLVLVAGSSAGGIGALLHADYFSKSFPNARVKVSPSAGFFYPGVSSLRDWRANATTPATALGFPRDWAPFLDPNCVAAVGADQAPALCTDAHFAVRHLRTPLFLRENLFDKAKLANCGLDARGFVPEEGVEYLKAWGGWMRSQLREIASLPFHSFASGYFAPSCLDHGDNLELETAPWVAGVPLVTALGDWLLERPAGGGRWPSGGRAAAQSATIPPGGSAGSVAMIPQGGSVELGWHASGPLWTSHQGAIQPGGPSGGAIPPGGPLARDSAIPAGVLPVPPRLMDECGWLPCTEPGLGLCSHLLGDPLAQACRAALQRVCAGLEEKGAECDKCVRRHAKALREGGGCPEHGAPVLEWWCDAGGRPRGHHVCDLAL